MVWVPQSSEPLARLSLLQCAQPLRVESGPDVGIALQIRYSMVEEDEPAFDLFDELALERVKKDFISPNESRFTFTIKEHGVKHFYRVFAESKLEKK